MNLYHEIMKSIKNIIITLGVSAIALIAAAPFILLKGEAIENDPSLLVNESNGHQNISNAENDWEDEFLIIHGELREYLGNSEIIIIPDSVTKIGDYVFSHCDFIKSVTIPDSVTRIGREAFYQCNNLTDILIPNTVTDIGAFAFSDTPWLKTKQEKYGLVIINDIVIDGKTCTGHVTIPDYVTKIGANSFSYVYMSLDHYSGYPLSRYPEFGPSSYPEEKCSITGITLPNSVTDIGDYAFAACTNLTEIVIPDSVSRIGEGAFHLDNQLLKITLPDSITSIGTFAFSDTAWLAERRNENPLVILNSIVIDGNACTGQVTIPDGVTSIGDYAFVELAHNDDTNLESSSELTGITIPDSVTRIGDFAFWSCDKLTDISMPNSVKSIGDFAFSGCTAIDSINIPNSVMRIGNWAFAHCTKLSNVTIPESVVSIGNEAFENTLWLKAKRGKNPFVIVNHILVTGNSSKGNIIISDTVKSISGYAFYCSGSIKSIKFPKSITKIENNTCSECSKLINVVLPDTITSIGDEAFWNCGKLRNLSLPDSLVSIGDDAFANCKNLTEVSIPNSVTRIGKGAFRGTSLTSIFIPGSVISIGDYAFAYCPDSFTIICTENSYAEQYARKNNIEYRLK